MPSFSTAARSCTSKWKRSGASAAMRPAVSARYWGVQMFAGVSTRYLCSKKWVFNSNASQCELH